MKKYFLIIVFVLFFCLSPIKFLTAGALDVVINEIAWMGTANSANDEWIELYNNTGEKIDLSDWKIENAGAGNKTLEISAGEISPKEFFLICKKEIKNCDIITGTLSLHNEYEKNGKLVLRDNLNNPVDQTPEPESKKWPAGDNKTKQTMERKNAQHAGSDSDNWQTSQNPGGTPKAKSSIFAKNEIVDVRPQQSQNEPEPKREELKPIIYPAGIVINEILPSPEGADADEEWIELKNRTDNDIDISGWKIQDINGSVTTYIIPERTIIAAQGFFLLPRPITKITLNNDEDGLAVLRPDGSGADKMTYKKAIRNQSYNNTTKGWLWSETLTPLAENIISEKLQEKNKSANTETYNISPVKKSSQLNNKKAAASVAAQKPFLGKSSSFFLTALFIAFFSAAIILFVKKRLGR